MLDILLFREDQGGNPELVRDSQRKRFKDTAVVDEIIQLDKEKRLVQYNADQLRTRMNQCSKEFGQYKRDKKEVPEELTNEIAQLKLDIATATTDTNHLEEKLVKLLTDIPNILHPNVPVSNNEDDNRVERTWGDIDSRRENAPDKLYNHVDLLHMIDGVEYEKGVSVAGNRGYFLKNAAVRLNFALITYGQVKMQAQGYVPMQVPYFMEQEAMAKCAQLEDFHDALYKVYDDSPQDKYLIATSEQPMCAYHLNEWIDPKSLPMKYIAISTCFRKETGSHGRDTAGIFRVHQFEKLEQFCVTSPNDDESTKVFHEMIGNAESFYKDLGIPYRVVSIVSGALNNAAAIKYDLEGWYPASKTYRELVSCSNCTDYQSRKLETRFGTKKMGEREKKYVHMLNSTLCATTRAICIILENNQTNDGIIVPEVLVPYMGTDFIPFVRPPLEIKPQKSTNKS